MTASILWFADPLILENSVPTTLELLICLVLNRYCLKRAIAASCIVVLALICKEFCVYTSWIFGNRVFPAHIPLLSSDMLAKEVEGLQLRSKGIISGVIKSGISRDQRDKDLPSGPFENKTVTNSHKPLGEMHHNLGYSGQSSRAIDQQSMDKPLLSHRKSKNDVKVNSQGKTKAKVDLISSIGMTSPKKTKSSTNLAALLGRGKSKNKNLDQEVKNKENEPPTPSNHTVSPPIWAEFSNQQTMQGTRVTLNDAEFMESRATKHMQQECSPSKARTPHEQLAPNVSQGVKVPLKIPAESHSEPKTNIFGLLRKRSHSKSERRDGPNISRPTTAESISNQSDGTDRAHSKVQAAIAGLNNKTREQIQTARFPQADIEKEFEEMLEARNIAPEVREKMRALDLHIKMDLLKQNQGALSQVDRELAGSRSSSRPGTRSRTNTSESVHSNKNESPEVAEKKPRPRSFTGFTLGKGGSSPKKQKQSKTSTHARGRSADLPRSTSTTSLNSVASTSSFSLFGKSPKPAVPSDFISYLRSNTRPQDTEVGKIQKLRQLLRNETVSWVNEFITDGGMIELVNLVYRIIEIEWR